MRVGLMRAQPAQQSNDYNVEEGKGVEPSRFPLARFSRPVYRRWRYHPGHVYNLAVALGVEPRFSLIQSQVCYHYTRLQ